jgi:hypothetical protein
VIGVPRFAMLVSKQAQQLTFKLDHPTADETEQLKSQRSMRRNAWKRSRWSSRASRWS